MYIKRNRLTDLENKRGWGGIAGRDRELGIDVYALLYFK